MSKGSVQRPLQAPEEDFEERWDQTFPTRTVRVQCRCGAISSVEVPVSGYEEWKDGVLIQDALPGLSPEERELLISGTCPECWEYMYG